MTHRTLLALLVGPIAIAVSSALALRGINNDGPSGPVRTWAQRRLARMFPSMFLTPLGDVPEVPLVHPDHPQRVDGVMHFSRGDRTDAEFRAFIKDTMAREASTKEPS